MTARRHGRATPRPSGRRGALARLALVTTLGWAFGCGHSQARSPARLRDAHVAALRADDPAAAYALLAPEVQATVSFEEFEQRWKADAAEHGEAIAAAESLDPALAEPLHGGTTVHDGGRVLRWTQIDDDLQVTEGLPGLPDTSTPAQAVRAFIRAVRAADLAEVRGLLGEPLLEAIDEDWGARVDAIEKALEEPGALDLGADLQRAELRYESNRVLTLEQTPHGWRITGLR